MAWAWAWGVLGALPRLGLECWVKYSVGGNAPVGGKNGGSNIVLGGWGFATPVRRVGEREC